MIQRITQAQLESMVKTINRLTQNPEETYTRENGRCQANVGNYHLSGAYGGWRLDQVCGTGGGIRSISDGYVSKRELYNFMRAFIYGIRTPEIGHERKDLVG